MWVYPRCDAALRRHGHAREGERRKLSARVRDAPRRRGHAGRRRALPVGLRSGRRDARSRQREGSRDRRGCFEHVLAQHPRRRLAGVPEAPRLHVGRPPSRGRRRGAPGAARRGRRPPKDRVRPTLELFASETLVVESLLPRGVREQRTVDTARRIPASQALPRGRGKHVDGFRHRPLRPEPGGLARRGAARLAGRRGAAVPHLGRARAGVVGELGTALAGARQGTVVPGDRGRRLLQRRQRLHGAGEACSYGRDEQGDEDVVEGGLRRGARGAVVLPLRSEEVRLRGALSEGANLVAWLHKTLRSRSPMRRRSYSPRWNPTCTGSRSCRSWPGSAVQAGRIGRTGPSQTFRWRPLLRRYCGRRWRPWRSVSPASPRSWTRRSPRRRTAGMSSPPAAVCSVPVRRPGSWPTLWGDPQPPQQYQRSPVVAAALLAIEALGGPEIEDVEAPSVKPTNQTSRATRFTKKAWPTSERCTKPWRVGG